MDAKVRIGVLTPHQAIGPEAEFPAMAPGQIMTHVVRLLSNELHSGRAPTSPSLLADLTKSPVLDDAARTLAAKPIAVVVHASTTSGYAIGFEAETAMVSRLSQLTGLPVAATCTAAVHALHVLGAMRIALIGAPWFDPEHNELGAAYFTAQGFRVVSSRSADLPQDPRGVDTGGLAEWVLRHVEDSAEAVFIGGNGFRATQSVDTLEAGLDRPVITSNQVLLWQVLALTGDSVQVGDRHGKLFALEP
ncbi:MAG: maleate cis-trans isomerase family protein [Nocardioidaceae bacterium]